MLKCMNKPPIECEVVAKAVAIMRGEKKNFEWKFATKMMNPPQQFLDYVIYCCVLSQIIIIIF